LASLQDADHSADERFFDFLGHARPVYHSELAALPHPRFAFSAGRSF
jgi:hypothetical protein